MRSQTTNAETIRKAQSSRYEPTTDSWVVTNNLLQKTVFCIWTEVLRERVPISTMNDRVLVTGACGFVGSHLIEHLLKWDTRLIATDLEEAKRTAY